MDILSELINLIRIRGDQLEDEGSPLVEGYRWLAENDRFPATVTVFSDMHYADDEMPERKWCWWSISGLPAAKSSTWLPRRLAMHYLPVLVIECLAHLPTSYGMHNTIRYRTAEEALDDAAQAYLKAKGQEEAEEEPSAATSEVDGQVDYDLDADHTPYAAREQKKKEEEEEEERR